MKIMRTSKDERLLSWEKFPTDISTVISIEEMYF